MVLLGAHYRPRRKIGARLSERLGLVTVVVAAALALAVAGCDAGSSSPPTRNRPSSTPSARADPGDPTVGALFTRGAYPLLHTCTASVVRSATGNVVLTAAHCVTGKGIGYRFAPGYRDGATPYGVWRVTAAYGDRAWITHRDPHRDWALLTVAPRRVDGRDRSLQSITGANRLGRTATIGSVVTVIGYAVGGADRAIRCTTRVYLHAGWPAFDCGGYVGGTSGAPWLSRSGGDAVVTGIISGLHQGGCTPATSYSAPLGARARNTLARAVDGSRPDVFPPRGSDGCS